MIPTNTQHPDIDVKRILKKKYYFQGFNGTPGLLTFGAPSSCKYMYEYLGYGYTVLADLSENDKCYYGYAWDDLHNINKHLMENIAKYKAKGRNYLDVIWQKHTAINKSHFSLLKKFDKINQIGIKRITDKELIDNYQILAEAFNKLLGVSHMVEGFTLTNEEKIRNLVLGAVKKLGREKEYNELIAQLTAPTFASFIGEAHNAIVLAAVKYSKGRNIDAELKSLEEKYYWLNNGYSKTYYLNAKYFMHEVKELVNKGITKEMETNARNYKKILLNNKKIKQKLFKELKLSADLVQLLTISDFMAKLQDNRKHITTITLSYVDNFLAEIAGRFNLKHGLVRYLIQAEVTLPNLKKITDNLLKQRRAKSIFFYTYESQKEKDPEKRGIVFTGSKAEQMIKHLMDEDHGEVKELRGNCASPGKVTATVKVCRGANEIAKVKHGDILVACMTQPEFVPAMKKAAAIITDEGGLTCHAAIVSRELGIPCIIGTRKATKVLKDGMKVEVDADNGIVRIL